MRTRTMLFALGAAALTLTGCTAPQPPAPTASEMTVDVSRASSESVCGASEVETSDTLTAAPTNQWDLVGTVAVTAENSGGGPFVVREGGERYCYAHTASGALAAAVGYVALASTGDAELLTGLIPKVVAPGEGRDAALAAPDALANRSLGSPRVVGFAVDEYSTDAATIDVVWSDAAQGDALVSSPTSLQWVEGDWKVVLDTQGQSVLPAALIDSLDGYIPWSDTRR